jgi:hypothetical protein
LDDLPKPTDMSCVWCSMPQFARTLAGLLAVSFAAGCISNPARGTKASGQPLRVRFDTTSGTYRAQEVVGTDNYYDSDGNSTGSVDRTRAVTKRWSNTDISFYQGDERLDEQDYYRIAGNQSAADEVAAARAQMSRDLTIGFPVAIAGGLGSTLAAIGTFGDGAAMRYGVSTGASVIGLVGMYFALRGLRTRNKKSMVESSQAIRHATEVEHCFKNQCRTARGGAKVSIQDEVKQLRPVVTPPPSLTMRKSERTLVGSWRGTSHNVLSNGSRQMKRESAVEVSVEPGASGSLVVVFDPDDPKSCRLEARLDGMRAELVAGQVCRQAVGRKEVKMTIKDGSSLELRGNQLAFSLEVELVVRDPGTRARSERMVNSMSGTATRM